jgi:hypothetical protein
MRKHGQDAVRGERLHAGYRHSIPGAFGTAEWKAIVDYLNGAELRQSLDQTAKVQ